MADKIHVLFYHGQFFLGSETFIYDQTCNPHVQVSLLAKKFTNEANFDTSRFLKYVFKRSKWDGLLSNLIYLFGREQYYFSSSQSRLIQLIKNANVQVIHAHFGFSAVRILPVARKLGIPLIVSFHGMDASKLLRKRPYRNALKEVFDYASGIVICNPHMKDVLPLGSAHLDKVAWIPYGIDTNKFRSIRVKNENQNQVHLLHIGRLVEKKGVPDLIRVFAQLVSEHKNILLHIVGEGPEENLCKAIVANQKIEQYVVFHGWKSHVEVKDLMQACDLFILNSRTAADGDSEGLPVGLLEAMAMQMPVVSTIHAGIPFAIKHNEEGLLVEEKNNQALYNAISLLIRDEEKRHKLGNAARRKIESFFSQKKMHDNLLELYRKATLV